VRLRDGSIDDAHLELILTIDEIASERWSSWMGWLRRLVNAAYRTHRGALLLLVGVCYRLRIWGGWMSGCSEVRIACNGIM
jgi:hypothetical protein